MPHDHSTEIKNNHPSLHRRISKSSQHKNSTKLIINFCKENRVDIRAVDLAALISAPDDLKEISLKKVYVEGKNFRPVVNALGSCDHLESFFSRSVPLRLCQSPESASDMIESPQDLIDLGKALAARPKLSKIHLEFSSLATLVKTVTPIVKNCLSLREVSVDHFNLLGDESNQATISNQKVGQLFQACGDAPSLQKLQVKGGSRWSGFGHGGLPYLDISFDSAALVHVGNMLRKTLSLQYLELQVKDSVDFVPLAEDLKYNSSLEELNLDFERSTTREEDVAFYDLLHHFGNHTLHTLWRWGSSRKLRYELALNRLGRKKLLKGASPNEWLEVIAVHNGGYRLIGSWELSITFYLLQQNPGFCNPMLMAGQVAALPDASKACQKSGNLQGTAQKAKESSEGKRSRGGTVRDAAAAPKASKKTKSK